MSVPPTGATQPPKAADVRRNPNGSEIYLDRHGVIVATLDVLGELREYQFEQRSGRLMVKRFGLWTKPEEARVDSEGDLYFRRGDMEILERLDGVHIQANKKTGVTIKNDNKNKTEIIELANGEVWKRKTTEQLEEFWIWKGEQPSFKSETYFNAVRHQARTPSGLQALSYVSRHEESWERGQVVREKFTFNNELNNERHVAVALQLGGGMLMLRNVISVTTFFNTETASETIYKLSAPTTLKVDIPIMKATLDNISEVRSVTGKNGPAVAFRKTDGSEQVLLLR